MSSDTNFGTGYYLSSVGGRGGGLKTLAGFRGGTTQICLKNEDVGGGDPESHQKLLGGITSVKQHSKGGSAKFHLV